jgi:hypothetical protein
MWKEENGLSENKLPALSELRSAGVTANGMESDIQDLSQSMPPPEGMEGGLEPEPGAAPVPGAGSSPGAGGGGNSAGPV